MGALSEDDGSNVCVGANVQSREPEKDPADHANTLY